MAEESPLMRKLCIARRKFIQCALGSVAGAAWCTAWAQNPFAPPPLDYPSLDLPGPGGLTARDLLNSGYWPVPALPPASGRIETTEIADNVHLLTGAGCNAVAVATGGGAILVDGGREEYSGALLAAVSELPNGGPVHTLFNTSWRPEYRGANLALGPSGTRIVAHRLAADWQSVRVIHPWDPDNPHFPLPAEARPNDTFRALDDSEQRIEIAGVAIRYARLPFAHTDGSIYVYFPDAGVAAIGGVTNGARSAWTEIEHRGNWPEIDWWTGGRGNRIAGALQTVAERTRPNTVIVPAQGGLLSREQLEAQSAMFASIMSGGGTDAINNLYSAGPYGRDEVLARFLANEDRRAYIAEWGDPTAFVYRSIESAWPTESANA
jgi:glyoxylase-like metal-dependent hydrolase (beta-lactamase superfamily II)